MPLDFSKGQIYVIRNMVNDKVYVGSTTQTISRRWSTHMTKMRNEKTKHFKIYRAMEELGVESFYIEFVEAWPCENKGQLCAREGHHIRLMDSVKNGYNDKVAGRTKKQRCEEDNEYRENLLKYYREHKKERYHSDNEFRENQLERTRKSNKERFLRYHSDNEFRENVLEHKKIRYHSDEQFREAVKERTREYRLRKKAERMQAAAQTELLELK